MWKSVPGCLFDGTLIGYPGFISPGLVGNRPRPAVHDDDPPARTGSPDRPDCIAQLALGRIVEPGHGKYGGACPGMGGDLRGRIVIALADSPGIQELQDRCLLREPVEFGMRGAGLVAIANPDIRRTGEQADER